MPLFNTILCPTDLLPEADGALGCAAALARTDAAKLVVLYCRREAGSSRMGAGAGMFEESLALNTDTLLDELPDWEGAVVSGQSVADAIVREAAVRRAELIVMRSRRRPTAAAVLGSTAEAVCRSAPCPVLVTHAGCDEWARNASGEPAPRRILVAYDFWDDAELALRYALALAARYDAELHLLHVVPTPDRHEPAFAASGRLTTVERKLEGAIPEATRRRIRVTSRVRVGQPYRETLAYAEELGADLVCMGARGRDFGARSLFGSNSDRVLRQAKCPVLIARPLRPATRTEPRERGAEPYAHVHDEAGDRELSVG